MDFGSRIMKSGVNRFYHCIRRGAVLGRNAGLIKTLGTTQILCDSRIFAAPEVLFYDNIFFGYGVRFFAAPAKFQVKASNESKSDSRQQINEQIQANVVRLITNEGNQIISKQGALQHAKIHKLDLVMVQSNANPPVCKLMDFNKEKYRQQMKEKERAKIKSSSNLKSAGFKEIKFSAKTEVKDLKMKADMIKKLMDRGHRVKCAAVSLNRNSKDEDDGKEDLLGLLDSLSVMIDEVAIFENQPIVDKRQAFFIVRHKKFGPLKKGGPAAGKKTPKMQEEPLLLDLTATPSKSGVTDVDPKWSISTTSHADFDHIFDLGDSAGVEPPPPVREMPNLSPEANPSRPRAVKIDTPTSPGHTKGPSFGIFSAPTKAAPPSPDLHTHGKEKQRKWGIFGQDQTAP